MGDVNYAPLGPSPVSEAWFEQRKVIGSTVIDSSPAAGSVFDVTGIQSCCRHLVEQWLESVVVVTIDEHDVDVRLRQRLTDGESSESRPDHDDPTSALHDSPPEMAHASSSQDPDGSKNQSAQKEGSTLWSGEELVLILGGKPGISAVSRLRK